MGVVISPESDLGKELAKHEQHRTRIVADDGPGPGNPYVYREFPRMLYKARQHPRTGQPSVMEPAVDPMTCKDDREFEQRCRELDNWNAKGGRIAKSADEELVMKGQGWSNSPIEALALFEKEQQEIARLAAEAAFHAQRMSEKARAELAEADASTQAHVVDVTGTRKGPRYVAPQDKG